MSYFCPNDHSISQISVGCQSEGCQYSHIAVLDLPIFSHCPYGHKIANAAGECLQQACPFRHCWRNNWLTYCPNQHITNSKSPFCNVPDCIYAMSELKFCANHHLMIADPPGSTQYKCQTEGCNATERVINVGGAVAISSQKCPNNHDIGPTDKNCRESDCAYYQVGFLYYRYHWNKFCPHMHSLQEGQTRLCIDGECTFSYRKTMVARPIWQPLQQPVLVSPHLDGTRSFCANHHVIVNSVSDTCGTASCKYAKPETEKPLVHYCLEFHPLRDGANALRCSHQFCHCSRHDREHWEVTTEDDAANTRRLTGMEHSILTFTKMLRSIITGGNPNGATSDPVILAQMRANVAAKLNGQIAKYNLSLSNLKQSRYTIFVERHEARTGDVQRIADKETLIAEIPQIGSSHSVATNTGSSSSAYLAQEIFDIIKARLQLLERAILGVWNGYDAAGNIKTSHLPISYLTTYSLPPASTLPYQHNSFAPQSLCDNLEEIANLEFSLANIKKIVATFNENMAVFEMQGLATANFNFHRIAAILLQLPRHVVLRFLDTRAILMAVAQQRNIIDPATFEVLPGISLSVQIAIFVAITTVSLSDVFRDLSFMATRSIGIEGAIDRARLTTRARATQAIALRDLSLRRVGPSTVDENSLRQTRAARADIHRGCDGFVVAGVVGYSINADTAALLPSMSNSLAREEPIDSLAIELEQLLRSTQRGDKSYQHYVNLIGRVSASVVYASSGAAGMDLFYRIVKIMVEKNADANHSDDPLRFATLAITFVLLLIFKLRYFAILKFKLRVYNQTAQEILAWLDVAFATIVGVLKTLPLSVAMMRKIIELWQVETTDDDDFSPTQPNTTTLYAEIIGMGVSLLLVVGAKIRADVQSLAWISSGNVEEQIGNTICRQVLRGVGSVLSNLGYGALLALPFVYWTTGQESFVPQLIPSEATTIHTASGIVQLIVYIITIMLTSFLLMVW